MQLLPLLRGLAAFAPSSQSSSSLSSSLHRRRLASKTNQPTVTPTTTTDAAVTGDGAQRQRAAMSAQKGTAGDGGSTTALGGRTHFDLIDDLASAGVIQSAINRDALSRVDRANYMALADDDDNDDGNAHHSLYAYEDRPQSIGRGATISAPHMHALALEDLLPPLLRASFEKKKKKKKPNDDETESAELSILDVGCGSGYLTATLGRMIDRGADGPMPPLLRGTVRGIDVVPALVALATSNICKRDADLLESGTVTLSLGDGWNGLPEEAPFHAIHVGAAAESFPKRLMMQLAKGGVMVVPVGPNGGRQYLYRITRLADDKDANADRDGDGNGAGGGSSATFREEDFEIVQRLAVRYVPLVRGATSG